MSTACPAAFNIPGTIPDALKSFLFFNLLIDSMIISLSIELGISYKFKCICLTQTTSIPRKLCAQKLLVIIFSGYFRNFITGCQCNIIISYALLTINFLISSGHPLCYLKCVTFLIIHPHNISKFFLLL